MPQQILTEEVKREIGQHFIVGFHGFEASQNIKTLIERYYLGNVILMKRNIQSAVQTRRVVRQLQKWAGDAGQERPLLVGIDQENGLVSAFSSPSAGATFPGAMALAATGSPEIAEKVAKASAKELKMAGINWVYSPVADVNTDSRNPVIGVRSFGDDPNEVAMFSVAVNHGTCSAGVAATAKHFPGHGDTHVDSHLALPRIEKTKAQIAAEELVSFAALIKAGIPSVMTGHMALPLVIGKGGEDPETPCSLSRVITTGILRKELGYEGVVVTDCLEMDAVLEGLGVVEGSVRALEAGADVVMICHTFERHIEAIEGVYRAVESGRISVEELRRSGERIGKMKQVYAAPAEAEEAEEEWEKRFAKVHEESLRLSCEVYPKSTTVVWNSSGVVPVKLEEGKGILVMTPRVEAVNRAVDPGDETLVDANGVKNTAGAAYVALADAVGRRGPVSHIVYSEGGEIGDEVFEGMGAVIWVMRNADLKRWQTEVLQRTRLRERSGLRVILVASCGPYDLVGMQAEYEDWTAYLATYEFTVPALETLAAVVFGETEGTGEDACSYII